MKNILKIGVIVFSIALIGLGIAYFGQQHSATNRDSGKPVITIEAPSKESRFYDQAFREPQSIERTVPSVAADTEPATKETTSAETAQYLQVQSVEPPKESVPLTPYQLALANRLQDFQSLRTVAIRDPQSQQNRQLKQALVERGLKRNEEPEHAQ